MADRYWVNNGGYYNDPAHWSASSGGTGGQSIPTSVDNVFFDANSITSNSQQITFYAGSQEFGGQTWHLTTPPWTATGFRNLTKAAGNSGEAYQLLDTAVVQGYSYILTYTITVSVGGNLTIKIGNQTLFNGTPSSGTFSINFTADANSQSAPTHLGFTGDSSLAMVIVDYAYTYVHADVLGNNIDFTGVLHNPTFSLTLESFQSYDQGHFVYGNATFISGMTFPPDLHLHFAGSGTMEFRQGDLTSMCNNIELVGSGTLLLESDLYVPSASSAFEGIDILNGIFDANDFNVTAENGTIIGKITPSVNPVIYMRSGTWTMGTPTHWGIWSNSSNYDIVINAGTSTMIFYSDYVGSSVAWNDESKNVYHNLIIRNGLTGGGGFLGFQTSGGGSGTDFTQTFNNITLDNSNGDVSIVCNSGGQEEIICNNFTANGDPVVLVHIGNPLYAPEAFSIQANNFNVSNAEVYYNTALGEGIPAVDYPGGIDSGNNTNWVFTKQPGKLQYRYVDTDGNVSWINLLTTLTNANLSFCSFWDNVNLVKLLLWVDGTSNIFAWNGAVTTIASNTDTTITKQGTTTWQQEGFSPIGSITIGNTDYSYNGGYDTLTLTGIETMPTFTVGHEVHQAPVVTPMASVINIDTNFIPTVIGCGRQNQVYLGSSSSNNLWISKVDNYLDYGFTSPVRVAGEGALISLDAPPTKFLAQEVTAAEGGTSAYDMWISEGLNTWSVIRATLSNDLSSERIEHIRLKTSPLQGAFSEKMVTKMKNHIMYLGNDKVASFVGYISYQYIPTIVDFSYPIIDDMNSYDFTDGSMFFHKNFAYLTVPKHGLIRAYNMTDQTKDQFSQYKAIEDVTQMPWFWEAPFGYPITGFYVTQDGKLGGHGYTTSQSYLLFDGGSFDGQDISANATFSFDDKGDRTQSKASDELWIEGYIKQNTTLSYAVAGDLDSFQTSQSGTVNGSDTTIVAFGSGAHSLGKNPLGSRPLGGTDTATSTLPAWFHVAKTYPQVPFYLEQISFASKGVDLNWELIDFGTNARFTPEGNANITQ